MMKNAMMKLIADTQAAGGVCAILDVTGRNAWLTEELVAAGVVLDDVLISQPDDLVQAQEIACTLVRTGAIDLVVVDAGTFAIPHHGRATAVIFAPGCWS